MHVLVTYIAILAGDVMDISLPVGQFTNSLLDKDKADHVILIAAGSGQF